jgi:DNA invertase Pin-like site-specific DNA recombinase
MMKKYVAYYRVSTQKQGSSGLGLEAQREAVRRFTGCLDGSCIEREYIEIESGRKNKRPQLLAAIAYAKANSCTLAIAKLDRLSRNEYFIFSLKESGVDFIAADDPNATPLSIGIYAVISANEARLVSSRTKAALAAKKAQGYTLGTPANLTTEAKKKAVEAIKTNARTAKEVIQVLPIIQNLRKEEKTYREIAAYLNTLQFTTRTGKPFTGTQVMRIEKRFP